MNKKHFIIRVEPNERYEFDTTSDKTLWVLNKERIRGILKLNTDAVAMSNENSSEAYDTITIIPNTVATLTNTSSESMLLFMLSKNV